MNECMSIVYDSRAPASKLIIIIMVTIIIVIIIVIVMVIVIMATITPATKGNKHRTLTLKLLHFTRSKATSP